MTRIEIQEHVPLAEYTTFRVGGPARYFIRVTNLEELQLALNFAAKHQLKFFVLAGGSYLIVSTAGFAGLVIFMKIESVKITGKNLTSGAATMMSEIVDESIARGLAGLEWAGGLPGTVGGAVRGNAGAFGGEIKDSLASVTALDCQTGELKKWTNKQCQFGYRDSVFKQQPGQVIVAATFALQPGDQKMLRSIADGHIQYRRDKHPLEYPNAGSIFKNTPVSSIPPATLKQWQAVIKTDPFPVVPTAKIIADAGLQGLRVGDAQVSEKHTNYIVNRGEATGENIVVLIKKVQAAVRQKFGVALEVEPELVGF